MLLKPHGVGKTALELVNILEKATLKKNLIYLTLLLWSEVFPRKKLIKIKRHWCPLCYQNNLLNHQAIYEPLLWSLTVVEICPVHKILLQNRCDYCARELPPLASNFRVGFCSKCNRWLGKSSVPKNLKINFNEEQLEWHKYVVNNVENLLTTSFKLNKSFSRNLISKSLNIYIEQITAGNIAAFARMTENPKNTVWMWSKGKSIPQLDVLLKICYFLNLSILDFFEVDKLNSNHLKVLNSPIVFSKRKERHSKSKSKIDDLQIRKYLEQSIVNNTVPPSITQISKELGHDRRVLLRKFPDLCRVISQKYLKHQRNITLNKINQYCLEVEAIATELHSQGIYPSEINVSRYINKPGYFRYKKVRNTLKKFLDRI